MFEDRNFAPLPGSLMAFAILGFLFTVIYRDFFGISWTFALSLFFIILFIASFISLQYGPIPERDLPSKKYM